MKKYVLFALSIICYLVGTGGLFYFIGWLGDLLPWHRISSASSMAPFWAVCINFCLIALFGVQHSVMARKSFKERLTRIVPAALERSIFVAISGLLCLLITWQWQALDGAIWTVQSESLAYSILYGIYVFGIFFLLASSFLINHFELFGLQQTYFHLVQKKAGPPRFVEFAFYRVTRHPIYLGVMMILWSAPSMTYTKLALALFFTGYIYIGIYFEEKDLKVQYGNLYKEYQARVPKLIPGFKMNNKTRKRIPAPELSK